MRATTTDTMTNQNLVNIKQKIAAIQAAIFFHMAKG